MISLSAGGLYAITADTSEDDALLERTETALRCGVALLQYRDKRRTLTEQTSVAHRLRALTRRLGVPFVINDNLALALECDADGVHLGRDEIDTLPVARHSRRLLIGVSCYDSLPRARDAVAAGADYVAFGSVFGSSTKPAAVRCGLEVLSAARAELPVPIVAIGGLSPENAGAAIAAGAHFIAVIDGVFGQPDVAAAVRRYTALFETRG